MASKKKAVKKTEKKMVVEVTAKFYINSDDSSEIGSLLNDLDDMIRPMAVSNRNGTVEITGLLDK